VTLQVVLCKVSRDEMAEISTLSTEQLVIVAVAIEGNLLPSSLIYWASPRSLL
jgi:hypothetical protein